MTFVQILAVGLTQLIAFLLFIWVIKVFAVRPVMQVLDERRDRIASQFDEVAAAEKRVVALREEYEENLREIDEEARKRVQEEVNRGKRIAEEIVENARVEANGVLEKARLNTEQQIDHARATLKEEVVAMTLQATERLIRERVDDAKHRELVASFISDMEREQ